jgi:hypothetical protein
VKSPSRVLFVFPNMPFAGGAERQSVVLIRGLRDLGDEVAVLTLKERGGHFRELEADAIPAFCAEMRSRVDLAGWRRALVAPPFSPDVVVSRSISAQIFGHVAAKRFQVPHVTLEQSPVDRTGEGLRLRVHQQVLLRLIARFVDVAIAVSASQISDLVRRGFARERIRVIPNSIDDARLRQGRAREEMRRELGIGSEEFSRSWSGISGRRSACRSSFVRWRPPISKTAESMVSSPARAPPARSSKGRSGRRPAPSGCWRADPTSPI